MQQELNPLYKQFPQFTDKYSEQLKKDYFTRKETLNLQNPFIVMHSDYLNLNIRSDGTVWTKSVYLEADVILEIRGSVTKEDKLKSLFQRMGKSLFKYDGCFGPLLWLSFKDKILLRPKGLALSLLERSIKNNKLDEKDRKKGNCYIQPHYDSKLLIRAKEIIPKQEEVLLDQESLTKFIYE